MTWNQELEGVSRLDSGHGGQTKDLDGDEADGYDEGEFTAPIHSYPF